MKICILSKADESGGGASRVAVNLAALLKSDKNNHVIKVAKTDNKEFLDLRGSGFQKILYKGTRFASRAMGLPDFLTTEYFNLKSANATQSDIFHVHDISNAISPLTIKKLSDAAPLVWTFHDCSPFTGGCIYPLNCTKFVNAKCSNCPQLHEWPLATRIDLTKHMQSIKIGIINRHVKRVICPSKWVARSAISAGISEHLISIIYNSVDTDLFHPSANHTHEKLKILLSSVYLNNRFKGGEHSLKIINNLKSSVEVIIVGKNGEELKEKIDPIHTVTLKSQTFDSKILASYYRESDLLLHTSNADNCPLTILESLASGVPVIALNIGGIPELIKHNVNGWLSTPENIIDAVKIIEHLDKNRDLLENWKKNSRSTAVEKFNNSIFLEKHTNLYREIIGEKSI